MSDTTKDRGIGDNSANIKTTDYKGLVHHVIAMLLEPRINIDTYLKDWIERARVATRLADKVFLFFADKPHSLPICESRLNHIPLKICMHYSVARLLTKILLI